MSEARTVPPKPAESQSADPSSRVSELKVSGHLLMLDAGLFCVFQAPGSPPAHERFGLPGVRISLPPGPVGRPEAVTIRTFREDGWLSHDSAALIRVADGQAHVLVTIYQAPSAPPDSAPRLQVTRLSPEPAGQARAPVGAPGASAQPMQADQDAEIVTHVQRTGDVRARVGEWAGTRGSRLWIEGFGFTPRSGIAPEDVEYQAVLGRGWLSPWIEGGKFCGSRGMALPLLGLKLRLKGAAAKTHDCSYTASFVDGSVVGPVPAGETCEAESLAALEAFQIVIQPRDGGAGQGAFSPTGRRTRSEPAPQPAPSHRSGRSRGPAKPEVPPRRSR